MEWNSPDAWLITLYGILVVFSGLILTSLLIYLFSIPERLKKRKLELNLSKDSVDTKEEIVEKPLTLKEASPEVMAVIITVLESEIRLKHNMLSNRV